MHKYEQAAPSQTLNRTQKRVRPTVQLRQMPDQFLQQTIGNQATAQLMQEGQTKDSEEETQYERATSLPVPLVQRIEKNFGISLDDVQVFYGSNKPDQLGAYAYAQGNQIHLAPNQEQHLPHEAWHIVQQRQGRVQPTSQLGDVMVNDQPHLEHEATAMGSLAASNQELENQYLSPQPGFALHPSQSVTQMARKTKNYSKNNDEEERAIHNNAITTIVDTIVTIVEQARQQSLQWSDLESRQESGYLQQWYGTAKDYCEDQNNLPSYFWANFGYAVETLACEALTHYSFGPYEVNFQVTHGHTRPDIVVLNNFQEIAWIDITSDGSETHIYDKDSSGWETKLFVYEVLYDSLDPLEVMSGSENPYFSEYGSYLEKERSIFSRERTRVKDSWSKKLRKYGDDHMPSTLRGGMRKREQLTTDFFTDIMGTELNSIRNKNQAIKGGIQELGGTYSEFGFKKARVNTGLIRRRIEQEARTNSTRERKHLAWRTKHSLYSDLNSYADHPLVKQFSEQFVPNNEDHLIIQMGFALHNALMKYDELVMLEETEQLENEAIEEIDDVLLQFPATLDVNALSSWITSAVRLLNN